MNTFPALMIATVADWAGIAGVAVGLIGVVLVILQLRSGAAATRAQATIQFQAAFLNSSPARNYLMKNFPVHEDVLSELANPELASKFRTWRTLDQLSKEDRENADAVVRAMNDVAQYVADGLKLRSALQQYHTIFVRAGTLLGPYLDQRNASKEGRRQTRWGRRMMDLFNAGIDYHRFHPKHKGRELVLERPAVDGDGEAKLILLDTDGQGVRAHPGFEDEVGRAASLDEVEMRRAVREAERKIRR
jgi:hypothetical protein